MYGLFCQHVPQTLPKGTSITTKPGMVMLVKQCLHHQNMFMATSHKHGKIGVHPIALPTSCMFFLVYMYYQCIFVLMIFHLCTMVLMVTKTRKSSPFMYHGINTKAYV